MFDCELTVSKLLVHKLALIGKLYIKSFNVVDIILCYNCITIKSLRPSVGHRVHDNKSWWFQLRALIVS